MDGEFKSGDLVVTPSGRIAKVNRVWEESRRDDLPRVDLTYADTGETVRLAPNLLRFPDGREPEVPAHQRKARTDSWKPGRRQLDYTPPPMIDPVAQLLSMDGSLKEKVQGRAGGLASRSRRNKVQQ